MHFDDQPVSAGGHRRARHGRYLIAPPCAVRVVPGLDARTPVPCDLEPALASFRPDVLHVQNVMNPAVLESAAALARAGLPVVVTVQDHRAFCPYRGKWHRDGRVCATGLDRSLCRACFDDAAYFDEVWDLTTRRRDALRDVAVVVLSAYMRDELAAAGVPGAHVIPPFVHGLDLSAAPDGPPCVLFAGRLVEAKGVLDAVAAWRASGLDLPLVFAGTGTLRTTLEAQGATVLGWIAHEQLAAVCRRAAVLLLPSRWQEPFGIAGLEALTLGVPVAAYDSGGIREWHPGPLAPWGDVDALAALVRTIAGTAPPPARAAFDHDALMAALVAVYLS